MPVEIEEGADLDRWAEEIRQQKATRWLIDFTEFTFPGYKAEGFHRYVAARLEQFERDVAEGRSPRLMIFAPPQHGKSELTSRRFPAWLLGRHPDWRIMLASYGADLAEEFSGEARGIVRGEEFAVLFGRMAVDDPAEAVQIDSTRKSVASWRIAKRRGGMVAVGVGGAITGRGADVLIVDDPVKGRREADSETYREDARAWWPQARDRVQKGGGILLMATRWHHDDLPGYLLRLAAEKPDADQWEVICLRAVAEEGEDDPLGRKVGEALAPGRFDERDLAVLKATIGSREWEAKFQQRPSPEEGDIFRAAWFAVVETRPEKAITTYQMWDTAFTRHKRSDRSVGGHWEVFRNGFRLVDVVYGRWEAPELKRRMRLFYEAHRPRKVYVENESAGAVLLQEWRRETRLPIFPYYPKRDGDKIARAHAATPLLEAGRVQFAPGPWMADLLRECLSFPEWPHDDFVDMLTMSLILMGVRNADRFVLRMLDFKVVA